MFYGGALCLLLIWLRLYTRKPEVPLSRRGPGIGSGQAWLARMCAALHPTWCVAKGVRGWQSPASRRAGAPGHALISIAPPLPSD